MPSLCYELFGREQSNPEAKGRVPVIYNDWLVNRQSFSMAGCKIECQRDSENVEAELHLKAEPPRALYIILNFRPVKGKLEQTMERGCSWLSGSR